MRDSHRLKEKFELSLDNGQLLTMMVIGLGVLGGVFFSGVVVGKKLALAQPLVAAPDLLSRLDEQNSAFDAARAPDALTFQDELTRKVPKEHVLDVTERSRPDERAAELKPAALEAPSIPPLDVNPEPKPLIAKPEVAVAAVKPSSENVVEAKIAAEPKKRDEKSEAIPTRTADAGGLKEAFGKLQKATPETSPTGNFTLQLSAYQDRAEADKFAAILRNKGYAPYVVEAALSGKGLWYRVRMGRFPSKEAASKYMDDFKRETSMNAMVTAAQ
jgi:DedD protein